MPRPTVRTGLGGTDPLNLGMFANAALLEIRRPGPPDRNGDPVGLGTLLWSGEALGYLTRIDRTMLIGGGREVMDRVTQDIVRVDVFQLPHAAGAPILEVAGPDWTATTVKIEDRRDQSAIASSTFRVAAMENRAVGCVLDHIRLEFERG